MADKDLFELDIQVKGICILKGTSDVHLTVTANTHFTSVDTLTCFACCE